MTLEPVVDAGQVEQLAAELLALRDQIAPKANPAELHLFARTAAHLDLDPFSGQICLVGRWDTSLGRLVHRHQITVAGRRAIADRTGRLEGIEGPQWSGPRNDVGELVWREVWDDDESPPYCARCLVHVEGWKVTANGTAKWVEFVQVDRHGKPTPTWRQMPSHMLGKVAESLALRRGFPEVAAAVAYGGGWPGPVDLEPDDGAIAEEVAAEVRDPRTEEPEGEPDPIWPGQVVSIRSLADDLELDLADVLGPGVELEDLTHEEAGRVADVLKTEARRRAADR